MAKQTPRKLTGIRRKADLAACYAAMIFSVLGIAQVFLAGSGMFGRDFDMHAMMGRILTTLALAMLIFALVARYSKGAMIGAAVLVALMVATTLLSSLGWDYAWLGGLHALLGIISVILAERLGRRVFRKTA